MSQVKKYKDIDEFFSITEEVNAPNLTLICLESFCLEYENIDGYIHYIKNELEKIKDAIFSNKKIYLCMATRKNSDSNKIIDYYKVWKTVTEKYRIDSFNLGCEIKIKVDDEVLYASCAEVDYAHLDIAITIMNDYRYRSLAFIYITPNDTMLLEDSIRNLFKTIVKTKYSFDLIKLYHLIQVNDVIINFVSDGELIDLLIAQKQP